VKCDREDMLLKTRKTKEEENERKTKGRWGGG
jgi:hypothetical protein